MGASRTCILLFTIHLISVVTAQEMEKRGPQGFLGMRGKKFIDSQSADQFYKRKPQFFVGVKGKKGFYDPNAFETPEFYFKRAPMGFLGMRGKRDWDDFYPESFEYGPKRGSVIGQIDYTANEDKEEFPILNEILAEYLNKLERPNPSSGPESSEPGEAEQITNEIEKRAASIHQFFGVRGKKSLQNKRDVSFRGKFIGVRGKKDLKNSAAQEIKFLLDQNGPLPKRKGPMGFIGMRGKKWAVESSPEMETSN